MNPANRRETGTHGEKLATAYLERRGYRIIETNYRCPEGEIDIIARQGETLVFVEVRAKSGRGYGTPAESITPAKKRRLRALAEAYAQSHHGLPESRRIDVVSVELGGRGRAARIELIANAVEGE